MSRTLIILCEDELKQLTDKNVSAPEADPEPVIAAHVHGTYKSAKAAEQALINFQCSKKHWIVEAHTWRRLSL
jgi:hypothetical protein